MPVNPREDRDPHINELSAAEANEGLDNSAAPSNGGRTPSTAPGASFQTGAGLGATGYDSPPVGSQTLSDPEVQGPEHAEPYYPPGGGSDNDPQLHDERNEP